MNSFAQKKQDTQGRASVNAYRERARDGLAPPQFVDDRPGTMFQKQLHETLNQSPTVVSQLRLQQSLNQAPRFAEQAKLADFLSVGQGGAQPAIQRQEVEEEDRAMGIERDRSTSQRVAVSAIPAEEPRAVDNRVQRESAPVQRKENNTGLADNLKMGVENLSGLAMDDVRVHYNSVKPARLRALAYTQGTNIHVGPGQEKHLGHEAWHVVQQKQGRVRATMQTKGVAINDDSSLEREADVMGGRAVAVGQSVGHRISAEVEENKLELVPPESKGPIQLLVNLGFLSNYLFSAEAVELTGRAPLEESSLDLARTSTSRGRGTAYIVNAIVSYRELGELEAVINAMIGGLPEVDLSRIAIVIGVNAGTEQKEKLMEAIEGAQDVINKYPFAIALVPLTFEDAKFPYGRMRNQVLRSSETRSMTEYFTHLGLHPYISIQDFDTGSRRVGSDEGKHIFHVIDELLKPSDEEEGEGLIAMDVQGGGHAMEEFFRPSVEEEGEGLINIDVEDEDEGGLDYLPLMIAGGYRIGDTAELQKRTKERLKREGYEPTQEELSEHLKQFVPEIEKDMKYRQQYARLDPMLPYAPEPNLFLDATAVMVGSPYGHQLAFGEGAAEFTELGKNVSSFAADELESYYTQKYEAEAKELKERGAPEGNLLDELKNELMIASQTNRHPIRGENVMVDYAGLNVETDLSRLAASAFTQSRTAQSHFGLTTVVDRFYDAKKHKTGSGASEASKRFSKQLASLGSIQHMDPLNPRWGAGKSFGIGKTMSRALSVPYERKGLFSGMSYGVQPEQKRALLYQIAIEQKMREYIDREVLNRAAMIENFRQQAHPLHGTNIRLRVAHWTVADGNCGVYALGYLAGRPNLTREELVAVLRGLGTEQANAAADGISGINMNRWLSDEEVANIGGLIGLSDIAVVAFDLQQNSWVLHSGDPATSNHIIGGVPASLGGPVNHWVVLRRD
jgi:hypothetical protein